MLIEDQKIAAYAAKALLSSAGHVVDLATTGREALTKFSQNEYDLLLIDIGLPDIDGTVVTQQIREQEIMTSKPHTPMVALTAHQTDSGYDLKVFDRVLNKPISLSGFNQLADLFSKPSE